MAQIPVSSLGSGPVKDLAEAMVGSGGEINTATLLWLHEQVRSTQEENANAEGEAPTGLTSTPITAPPPLVPPTPPPAPPVDTSYDAFRAAYKKAFGRDITQAELNDNGTITIKDGKPVYTGLYQLSNDLIKLLPLGRLVGFDARRLALMSGRDLLPLFKEYPNALFDFGTDYLSTSFSSTEIQGFIDSMKKLQPTHPSIAELQNVVKKVQGKEPVTTEPVVPGDGTTRPVSSKWQIPQLVSPTASGETPLELYLSMIGAKQPSGATTTAGKARTFGDETELPPSTGTRIGDTETPYEGQDKWVDLPNGQKQQYVWVVDERHPSGYWAATNNILTMPKATTGGKAQAEIDADLATAAQQIEASKAAIEIAKQNYELAKSQNDREAQYAALNYQRSVENALEQAQSRQAELELQRQQLATQERLGLGELGLKTQAQLGYADMGKDVPTLERELAAAQTSLNNFKAIADSAYQAGNIALAENAQKQAQAQFERTQALTEEIQKGQLGLQTAGVTGAYGGMPTLEAEIQRGQLGLQAGQLTGQYGGMPTLEAQAQGQQFGLAQAGVTGTYGGAPTLQSLRQQADIAYQAAQVALAQGNQDEARRQFNLSYQLEAQAQEFAQGMETAQMEREVMASPIGLIEQIYRARGQAIPTAQSGPSPAMPQMLPERPAYIPPEVGTAPGTARIMAGQTEAIPTVQGEYIPPPTVQTVRPQGNTATIPTRMEPLTWEEINRSGRQLPAITETMAGREPARYQAGMPLLSSQAEGRLLPSERRVFQAELGAMGVNQEDYYSERNRQARTGTPYRRMPTVRRPVRQGGFI